MRVCSKCKVEKNDSEYYTYYHSTNKKFYTRHICQDCMKKQSKQIKLRIKEQKQRLKEERIKMIELLTEQNKVEPAVPELIVEDYSTNPQYRKCTVCQKYKLLEEFYQNKNTLYYHSRCKECHRDYSNGKLIDYYQEKYRTTGGSERVLPKAGHFMDIYQEEQVSWLLQLIGWRKDGDVWVKKGIKKVVDGNIVWDKIAPKERKKRIVKHKRFFDIKGIVKLRKDGLTLKEIAQINSCSQPTIRKILSEVNEEERNS